MKLFAVAALLAAASTVLASPTRTIPELVARGPGNKESESDCNPTTEFYYTTRSCCLPHGGPKTVPNPPSGIACPSSWYYHSGQGCCVPKNKPKPNPPTPTCSSGWSWSHGLQCCKPPYTPPNPPKPSQKPHNNNGNGNDQWEKKRVVEERKAEEKKKHRRSYEDMSPVSYCPKDVSACPIISKGVFSGDYECVDIYNDVNSCGGCVSEGKGEICSADQSCVAGSCVSEY